MQLFRDRRLWPRLYDEELDELRSHLMKFDTTIYMNQIREHAEKMKTTPPHEQDLRVTWVGLQPDHISSS